MKAPKLPSFIKTSTNRQFQMQTRYYNERKERIQEARAKAETKNNGGIEKGYFSNAWRKKPSSPQRSSSLRVLIIIATLSLVAYWILKF